MTLEVPGSLALEPPPPQTQLTAHGAPNYPTGDIKNQPHIKLKEIAPAIPVDEAPEYLPDAVATSYMDGAAILRQKRWTAAAGCFRTALDRATKLLWKDAEKNESWPKELSSRIQQLKTKMRLPDAIVDWAHQVRIVGNEIHDLEDVTEEDAKDAGHFAELFLIYTFTLPKRLEEFRARRAAP